jgi:hypothetical protein
MVFFLAGLIVLLSQTRAVAYIDPGTGVTFAAGFGALIWGFLALILGTIGITFKKWWAYLKSLVVKTKN